MIAFPDINPVALELGPVKIHWYGLMYLIGFGAAWSLGRLRTRDPRRDWSGAAVQVHRLVLVLYRCNFR